MNNIPRKSRPNPLMATGLFILSTALIIISVIKTYYDTGKMNWILLIVVLAMNVVGIIRAVRQYRKRKEEEKEVES
ncbi:MAG: hypothetical protein HF314_15545 [Ignavibacteria bacterium]|jgi:general stress protein CsbA|nr:hypothetical protein [Ignavibacteria bacterium]MCU7504494.1 hypothetical protein [Ignavibacteria bacterium]MCU7517815.1 hypothetical protein [Ignavibacteria bacterium]